MFQFAMLVITRGYLFPSLDQGRLFVKNLPYDASEDDIAKLFAKRGKVAMDPWCVSAALQYL